MENLPTVCVMFCTSVSSYAEVYYKDKIKQNNDEEVEEEMIDGADAYGMDLLKEKGVNLRGSD